MKIGYARVSSTTQDLELQKQALADAGWNRIIVEYALSDVNKPIGVSEYQLVKSLPDNLKSSLPSIEDIEHELQDSQDEDYNRKNLGLSVRTPMYLRVLSTNQKIPNHKFLLNCLHQTPNRDSGGIQKYAKR